MQTIVLSFWLLRVASLIFRFLRAVSYRWLARWLFGPMGWENTRPLPACVYDLTRQTYATGRTTGYVSGQERAIDE